jgi:hypothetical protein
LDLTTLIKVLTKSMFLTLRYQRVQDIICQAEAYEDGAYIGVLINDEDVCGFGWYIQ